MKKPVKKIARPAAKVGKADAVKYGGKPSKPAPEDKDRVARRERLKDAEL